MAGSGTPSGRGRGASKPVGILALQGDYEAHARAVRSLSHEVRYVRTAQDLDGLGALLLPGGESTTMWKLLQAEGMATPLARACHSGLPVLATCAGAILLAHAVDHPAQDSLDVLDIDVERNAYGRQRESFVTRLPDVAGELDDLEAVFIRAPVIRRTGPGVEVLARHGEDPVLVREGSIWAATFHPEMTSDTRLLQRVLGNGGR